MLKIIFPSGIKKSLTQIKPDELAFDLTIAAFLFITGYFYKQTVISPFQLFIPETGYIILTLIVMAVMINMGMVLQKLKSEQNNKVIRFALHAVFLMVAFSHLFVVFANLYAMDTASWAILVSFMPHLIIMVYLAYMAGESMMENNPDYFQWFMIILILFLLAFIPLIVLITIFHTEPIWTIFASLGLLMFGGVKIAFQVPEMIFKKWNNFFVRLHNAFSKGILRISVKIIFPVLLGAGLLILQDLIDRGNSLLLSKQLQIIIAGIIPVRFLWALAPPRNMINLLSALIILILLLFSF